MAAVNISTVRRGIAAVMVICAIDILVANVAFACKPGPITCPPDDAAIRGYLAKRYPDIAVALITFSIKPFGHKDDVFQRFNVEFTGSGRVTTDLFEEASNDDLRAQCHLSAAFEPLLPEPGYKRVATTGDAVTLFGDTTMHGKAGLWVGAGDFMSYQTASGTPIYGNSVEALGRNLIILGKETGDTLCLALKRDAAAQATIRVVRNP